MFLFLINVNLLIYSHFLKVCKNVCEVVRLSRSCTYITLVIYITISYLTLRRGHKHTAQILKHLKKCFY